jgi:hypothetical protein
MRQLARDLKSKGRRDETSGKDGKPKKAVKKKT